MPKIVWTKHALNRTNDRKIPQSQILKTISDPDSKINNSDGSIEVKRSFGNQKVHTLFKETDEGEYLILSCWVNPPNYDSSDFRKYKLQKDLIHASQLKKLWLTFLNQVGL